MGRCGVIHLALAKKSFLDLSRAEEDQRESKEAEEGNNMDGNGVSGNKLPPLPPSDPDSLRRNSYDGFYKQGAREFWGENEIDKETVQDWDSRKCKHEFVAEEKETGGIRCTKCNFGLTGPDLKINNGKLFIRGKEVVFD